MVPVGNEFMETILDSQAIQKLLPHRFPFLLVDRIVELVPRERGIMRLYKVLRRKGRTAMLVDLTVPPSQGAVAIDCFGLGTSVTSAHAWLHERTGVPIVPVAIVDSDRVWPKGRRLPRIGGRIVVRVGSPFSLDNEATGDPAARRRAKGHATRTMMGRVAALLPPRQRGAYADAVPESGPR